MAIQLKLKAMLLPLASLISVSCGQQFATNANANDMLEWAERNTLVNEDTWKGVSLLSCRPVTGQLCGPKGCQAHEPKVRLELVPGGEITPLVGTIRRCDAMGCDEYTANLNYSGFWMSAAIPGRASFARFASGGDYIEVATLNQDVLIYRGQCEAKPKG